ncbi:hypothetical protein KW784_01180 [Candidatus Parcubacteria bacterium]|nr:hypothetical protein [Candidatus Parcubacteria bacterium]
MRPGIIMALLASLAVVSWATWYRLVGATPAPGLVAVANQEMPQAYYDELVSKFADTATSTPPAGAEPFTTTDLVGRQLIMDYISLAQNGQATEDNLSLLADKYVESIPTVISAEQLSGFDLHIVPNDRKNFESYSAALEEAYRAYATSLIANSGDGVISPDTAGAHRFSKIAEVYKAAASALKNLSVPAELAEAHLALVNIYLQDAAAAEALAGFDTDPTSSFAGLLAYKSNAEKEAEILSGIKQTLTGHGI